MNRTDAATVLGIDASASSEEAKRAYQELFTEHQVRLTNAPTPALRSLYQARLLELDEARDAFLTNSLSDADSDLPTDQPSIPTSRSSETSQRPNTTPPPSPPLADTPRRAEEPPARREEEKQPVKKSSSSKWIGVVIGLAVVLVSVWQLPRVLRARSDASVTSDRGSVYPPTTYLADSLPRLRENVTVARVEFGRGDYDAANAALKEADSFYSRIAADAKSDTAVVQIKSQLDSLHGKVQRACDALKKVAERHPGEPTCKSI